MTTQAIAPIGPRDYTPEQVALIKSQIAVGASDLELQFFMSVCARTGLDPFKKEIYAVKRSARQRDGSYVEKLVIQYGIDGLLALAERTRTYDGATAPQFCAEDGIWRDVWLAKTHPAAAKIGVYRKGLREPVWGVAVWDEYVQTTRDGKPLGGWATGPSNQLEKCALAKAIRRACPNAFDDLPTDTMREIVPDYVDMETGEVTAPTEHPQPAGAILWNAETGETLLHESEVRVVDPPKPGRQPAHSTAPDAVRRAEDAVSDPCKAAGHRAIDGQIISWDGNLLGVEKAGKRLKFTLDPELPADLVPDAGSFGAHIEAHVVAIEGGLYKIVEVLRLDPPAAEPEQEGMPL